MFDGCLEVSYLSHMSALTYPPLRIANLQDGIGSYCGWLRIFTIVDTSKLVAGRTKHAGETSVSSRDQYDRCSALYCAELGNITFPGKLACIASHFTTVSLVVYQQ